LEKLSGTKKPWCALYPAVEMLFVVDELIEISLPFVVVLYYSLGHREQFLVHSSTKHAVIKLNHREVLLAKANSSLALDNSFIS
jgi:hypothetical protein